MKRALLIAIFALCFVACGDDTGNGDAGNGGSSGAAAGGTGGASGAGGTSGTSGTSGTGGTGGTGGDAAQQPSELCLMLIAKATDCGFPAPDPSDCEAENACEDGCTLAASCQDLSNLASGNVPPSIQTCFDGCP